ncbi:unnamed protein product [Rhizopus stolonifer]
MNFFQHSFEITKTNPRSNSIHQIVAVKKKAIHYLRLSNIKGTANVLIAAADNEEINEDEETEEEDGNREEDDENKISKKGDEEKEHESHKPDSKLKSTMLENVKKNNNKIMLCWLSYVLENVKKLGLCNSVVETESIKSIIHASTY